MKLRIALLSLLFAGASFAGPLTIDAAYSHPTAAPGVPGVGFFTVHNSGKSADRLLSASSPGVGRIEIHRSNLAKGVMQMRAVAGGVAVPAGGVVAFAPGGLHLMLFDLAAPLQAGQSLPLTLQFERAGAVAVDLQVKPRVAEPEAEEPHGEHSHRGHAH